MSRAPLSPEASRLLALRGHFETYAHACLKIANKAGKIVDFKMNRAQRYLHARIEDQIKRTGRARILCLKGRQQGVSTYIGGRFYWKASGEFGRRFVILTHLDEATANLFAMVKRYHDNAPPAVKPKVRTDNAKELSFEVLQTKYSVATAGSRGTGRSATAQYFHGSEVAYWPNAEKHMAGIGQIVPDEPGTEILFESTANGIGNLFYNMVMDALKGKGDYELVFIPWYWEEPYRRKVPAGTLFEPDEIEYQETFGIDDEQLYWRRMKIINDFSNDTTQFDAEYPATVEMAFLAGTSKALIPPLKVAKAIANALAPDTDPDALVLGVDPAEYGSDDTAATLRRGRKVIKTWRWSGEGNAQIAGRIGLIIDHYADAGDPIDAVNIDVTGVGTGVEAILTDQGYRNIYRVHFGERAIEDEKYRNRGAECWARMRDWLEDGTRQASLPTTCEVAGTVKEDAVLQSELSSRNYTYDARRRMVLQSKEEMRKNGIASPNMADSLALTFAVNVRARTPRKVETLQDKLRRLQTAHARGGSPGMAA